MRCTLERVLRVVQHPFERVIAKLSSSLAVSATASCLRCTLERVLRVVQHPFERVVAGLSCSPLGRETLSDTVSILNTTTSNYFRVLLWHLYRFGWV